MEVILLQVHLAVEKIFSELIFFNHFCKFLLDAAIILTLTGIILSSPGSIILRSSSTRSSLVCIEISISPISSRKMVPLCANSNNPTFPPFLAAGECAVVYQTIRFREV